MNEKMRVWWSPQIGYAPVFYIPVESVHEAKKVMDILAAYDLFQLNNNIKPDFSNAGGLEVFNEEAQEWCDFEIETEDDYFDNVDEYIESLPSAEMHRKFTEYLFSQV